MVAGGATPATLPVAHFVGERSVRLPAPPAPTAPACSSVLNGEDTKQTGLLDLACARWPLQLCQSVKCRAPLISQLGKVRLACDAVQHLRACVGVQAPKTCFCVNVREQGPVGRVLML